MGLSAKLSQCREGYARELGKWHATILLTATTEVATTADCQGRGRAPGLPLGWPLCGRVLAVRRQEEPTDSAKSPG
jgi:hypothetical protein